MIIFSSMKTIFILVLSLFFCFELIAQNDSLGVEYFDSGEKKSEQHFQSGKAHGDYLQWEKTGELRYKGQYELGALKNWTVYFKSGEKQEHTEYKNRQISYAVTWYLNGNKKTESTHPFEKIGDFIYRKWDENGIKTDEQIFRKSVGKITFISFYSNGNKKAQHTVLGGHKTDSLYEWTSTGTPLKFYRLDSLDKEISICTYRDNKGQIVKEERKQFEHVFKRGKRINTEYLKQEKLYKKGKLVKVTDYGDKLLCYGTMPILENTYKKGQVVKYHVIQYERSHQKYVAQKKYYKAGNVLKKTEEYELKIDCK
jgi:antitoxin component YwqK of YwqJK toxin-antitoxin module